MQTIKSAIAMLSEMHLAPQEWPCVLPAVQAVLNYSPFSHRAGEKSPTAFTGHARDPPHSLIILHPFAKHSLSFIKLNNWLKAPNLPTKSRNYTKKCQRRYQDSVASKFIPIMLTLILCSQISLLATMYSGLEPRSFQHKLTLVWKGPYQVEKIFVNRTLRVNSLEVSRLWTALQKRTGL
jgi:hypothetical protein